MSEVQNPVEAPVVAPVEETPVTAPVAETTAEETAPAETEAAPAAETAEETAPAEEAAVPAEAESTKQEFSGEGVLGYKGPGGFLKKLAGFQKKFFWFGDEAVEPKHLSSYLRGEKAEVANHNAAWSSQTGKGLLYFSKHASEKATPAGIINLADATDITEEGSVEFFFHVHAQKHVFQAATVAERDSWVAALKTKSVEAKESAEGITSSDGYKEHHGILSKPVVAGAATATGGAAVVGAHKAEAKKEEKAEAKEEKAEAKEEKKEEKAAAKEEKKEEKLEVKDAGKSRKSRSASRKRTSIFGGFGIGSKKEEKAEAKDTTPVEPTTEATTSEGATEVAPLDGPAVAAAVVAAPLSEEPVAAEATPAEATRPVPSKRNSVFGNLSSRFASKKTASEEGPAVPAKDATPAEVAPVSAEAPVIPEPEATEPLATSIASPETVPTETTAVTDGAAAPEESKETKPTTKSEKRKSSLPFSFGNKKEKPTSDSENEKPLSPFAKLRQTVKSKSSPKAAEKTPATEEKAAESTPETSAEPTTEVASEAPAESTPAAESEVVSEPVPVASTTTPQVAATA